ncbi:MAG: hypothetical protein JF607_19040 [Burkholderiales bacterium]|nr:hypothetical protein [Burkholderiales bacterium]MBW8890738.1 hypothetical protein [Burkholderiales bacterium]
MKRLSLPTLVLATAMATVAVPAAAQNLTREQVKMDRDAFLALMRWDELTGMWVLKSNMEPPKGVMSRAEVLAMRDQFLRMNVYDDTVGSWVPIKAPRDMSTLTREQVNMETLRFLMMYRYDESRNEWISRMR